MLQDFSETLITSCPMLISPSHKQQFTELYFYEFFFVAISSLKSSLSQEIFWELWIY